MCVCVCMDGSRNIWTTACRHANVSLGTNHAAILIPDRNNNKKRFLLFLFFPFFSVGCCRGSDIARGKNNKGDFLIESDGGHQRSTTKKKGGKKKKRIFFFAFKMKIKRNSRCMSKEARAQILSSPSTGSAAFQPVRPRKKRKDDR